MTAPNRKHPARRKPRVVEIETVYADADDPAAADNLTRTIATLIERAKGGGR